ncbi:hypothetical protein [Spongorhabdus nitratireducens]
MMRLSVSATLFCLLLAFTASLSASDSASANKQSQWVIKVDCCKASGCYVSDRFRFEKQLFKAKRFNSAKEAEEYLKQLSLKLKRQHPKVLPKA